MPNKFSSFSPSGRKELLEKLTKSDFMVEDIKQRVSERANYLNAQLRICEDTLLVNNTQLATLNKNAEAAQKELDKAVKPDFITQINELTTQITAVQKDIEDKTEQIKVFEKAEQESNEALVKVLEENTAELSFEKEAYDSAYKTCFTEKTRIESEIRSLNKTISSLKAVKDTCPTCGQKLPGAVKPDTSEQEKEVAALTESLTAVSGKLNEYNTKHAEYQAQIKAKYDETIKDLKTKVAKAKHEKEVAQRDLSDFTHYQDLNKEQLTKLNYDKDNWDKYYNKLNKTIEDLNKEINQLNKVIQVALDNKTDLTEHISVVRKMDNLIKRDFRGYLLENIIKYVDQKAKDYCNIVFGTRELNVYLDGNALDISYCNKMFDNLSGGEKQRVDLILQFAIRDMLNAYLNSGSNILVLDEITDFLDKQSCAAVMKLIERELTTIESVFVVSHHAAELELPIDSEIKIVKNEYGISEIV